MNTCSSRYARFVAFWGMTLLAGPSEVLTFGAAAEQAAASAAEAGLVAHWTFDEGRGDVARDVTGNGHDAALKHVEWVPSPRGHAVRFDSKDDAAVYGDPASMNMSGDMTLAVWVKVDPTVDPDTTHLLIGDTGPAVERNFSLYLHGPGVLRFEWTDGKTVAPLTAPSRLLNGTWKHIAVVANSTARHAAMYIDGQLAAEMPMPVPITKTVFKERSTGWFYNGFFTGELDDVRLYSRALTAAEVQGLFRAQADVVVGAGTMVYSGGTGPRAQTAVTVAQLQPGTAPRRIRRAEPAAADRRSSAR